MKRRNMFVAAYSRSRRWIATALIVLAFIGTRIPSPPMQEAATYALVFIALSVIFDIYKSVNPVSEHRNNFRRFNEAATDFRARIEELLEKNREVSIKWIGMTMEYGGPALLDIISSIDNGNQKSVASVKLVMLDPSWSGLEDLHPLWKDITRVNKEKLQNTLDPGSSEIHVYAHVPNVHGFVLNDRHFYISTCRWLANANDFRMTGGENEYVYIELGKSSDTDVDALNFLKWFEFYQTTQILP